MAPNRAPLELLQGALERAKNAPQQNVSQLRRFGARRMDRPWYCAQFSEMPNLGDLAECRRALGPELPLFFSRAPGGGITLYVPPARSTDSFLRVAACTKLPPFVACVPPPPERLRLLFGDEEEAKSYLRRG